MSEMKFFVYGSMSEGLVHFERIKNFVTGSWNAQILGKAYRLQVGFPVVCLNGSDFISGQLVAVSGHEMLLSLLDQFHGYNVQDESKSLYFRREVNVVTNQGTEKAWCYVINEQKLPKTAQPIAGGDWRQSLEVHPALTEKLTEKQISYIKRLGAASGREIVPINDLPLYRELMNLEIIVDKGRRLALSKLGHEVYRYLT